MRIMSFNTQHCKNFYTKKVDYNIMSETIKKYDADIVGLNEIHGLRFFPFYGNQTHILSQKVYMDHSFFGKALNIFNGGPYGNALLSKIPIIKAETIKIPDPKPRRYKGYYESRCVLKALLKGGITVLVTHFGLNPDEQENAVKTVCQHITTEKCILLGDFNMTPDNTLLKPIREVLKDTAEVFSSPLMSFPSDKPNRKLDYIFVSHEIEILHADIPSEVASDHRPCIVDIKY